MPVRRPEYAWGVPKGVAAVDGWMWALLVTATALTVGLAWKKRRARRVYVIDHVKIEIHPPCVVEDRVVEQVWRAAISMTNASRRPRPLPLFAERATVRAGRYVYLAEVYLDGDVPEVNPRDVALAWIEFALPSGLRFGRISTDILEGGRPRRALRWAPQAGAFVPSPCV